MLRPYQRAAPPPGPVPQKNRDSVNQLINRLFNIRQDEGPKVLTLVIIFFLFITGTAWAETIIESSFYHLAGVSRLSDVFTLHALVSLVATAVYSAFVDRTSNQKLLVAVCAVAVVLVSLGVYLLQFNEILAFTLLYVLVRAVRTSFVIHWWNYASDFYDARAAKRIVPLINGASRFAIIVAGLTIPLLNSFLTPAAIVLLWVATLLVIALLSWGMRGVVGNPVATHEAAGDAREHVSFWRNIREGFQYVSNSNYLRWLALSTFLMVIIFAMLNYSGGLIFTQQFKTRAEITNFIGFLNGVTNLLMLPVQLFLFSRMVARIGVGNANVIFPAGTLLISAGAILWPGTLASGALAHFDRNTFRYSTQETSNNLLYNAVPARIKGRARSFIDGLVLPVALLVSSALLQLGKLMPPQLFLPVLLGLPALAYLLTSLVIRNSYSKAMIELLEQEDLLSMLPGESSSSLRDDPDVRNTLLKKLAQSTDESITLIIVRILAETAGSDALPMLKLKAAECAPALRANILDVMTAAEDASLSPSKYTNFFYSFLHDPDPGVRLSALRGLQQVSDNTSQEFLAQARQLLDGSHALTSPAGHELRAQALVVLLNSEDPALVRHASQDLDDFMSDSDPDARGSALSALGHTTDPRLLGTLLAHLDDESDQVRLRAVMAVRTRAARRIPFEMTNILLSTARKLLADPLEAVRLAMLDTLEQGLLAPEAAAVEKSLPAAAIKTRNQHQAQACELISTSLLDASPLVRKTAADVLVRCSERSTAVLLRLANDSASEPAGVDSLSHQGLFKSVLCRIDVEKYGGLVEEQIMSELQAIYLRSAQLNSLRAAWPNPDRGRATLLTYLSELNDTGRETIFTLLEARHGENAVQRIRLSLTASSSHTRANASEALEALISPALVKLIMPLFDSTLSPATLARVAASAWGDTRPRDLNRILDELLTPRLADELVRAITVFSLDELAKEQIPAAPHIVPNLLREPTPPPSSEPAPVQTRRPRLNNLFDALAGPTQPAPTPRSQTSTMATPSMVSLEQINQKLQAALQDPSPLVRATARRTSSRISYGGPALPAPVAPPQAMIPEPQEGSSDPNATIQMRRPVDLFKELVPVPATSVLSPTTPADPGDPMANKLTTIERIIFLKQVNLFQSMTIDQLKVLASICEEEMAPQGKTIFAEGDPGGVVYVVVSGRVGIERPGERTGSLVRLATLESHASFGEMNMFDDSPRSASAVAVDDSLLLKLRAAPFLALIRQQPDLSLELIKVLSQRIREANDQVARLSRSTPRQLQKLYDKLEDNEAS